MTAMNLLIVLWLLAATAASFSVHPHRVQVYPTIDFKARLRLSRSFYPRTRVTQLTSSGVVGESNGPDEKDNSIATNSAGSDVIKNHHDSHHAALHHLKELTNSNFKLTNSKVEALENSAARERENFQREIDAVRTYGENRIVASETAYRDVNQANDGKSQARYDSIMMGINALGDKIDATNKATNQKIDATNKATNQKIDATNNATNQKIDAMNQKLDKQSESIDELKAIKIQASLIWQIALVVLGAVGSVFIQFISKKVSLG
jgi:hypothetical protein